VAGKRCGRRCARAVAIVVGLGTLAGAALSAAQVAVAPEFLRSLRWPLHVAVAAQLFAFALLVLAGALIHPATILVATLPAVGQILGDYESENFYLPILALAVVALFFAYRRSGGGVRSLGVLRLALLALALASALGGVIATQAPTKAVFWQRLRTPSGGIDVQRIVYDGTCEGLPARDVALIDQGCDIIIPTRRARFVIGYAALSVLLGVAAVAGAKTSQDETPVP
jgi:hypothetical protein